MIDFFLVFLCFLLVSIEALQDGVCNTHTTILRQFEREGFHIDIHYFIELVVDIETAFHWENCSLLIKENITNSFYVNPDQLSELNRTGVTQACTFQNVNIETPQHLSKPHTVYVYGVLKRSQNLIQSHVNFPLHLRYHKPKVNGGYSLAELKLPVLLINCPNMNCKNLIKSKAPCSYCGGDLCTYYRFNYKTNNNNMTLPVPVGNINHLWFVSFLTYFLTFGGCLYVVLAITLKGV